MTKECFNIFDKQSDKILIIFHSLIDIFIQIYIIYIKYILKYINIFI
jgi:hypothetical protein